MIAGPSTDWFRLKAHLQLSKRETEVASIETIKVDGPETKIKGSSKKDKAIKTKH